MNLACIKNRYQTLAALGLGLLAAFAARPASAAPIMPYNANVLIDGANATISGTTLTTNAGTQHGIKLEGNGRLPSFVTMGGSRALKMWCEGGTTAKDRNEIELVGIPVTGVVRYTRFRVYIPAGAPTGWLVLAQWHRSAVGRDDSPPVALNLEPNAGTSTSVNMLIAIRNEDNRGGLGGVTVVGTPAKYMKRVSLAVNTWHTITVRTRFYDYTNNQSRVAAYLGSTLLVDHTGSIGYANAVANSFYHKFGNYRQSSSNTKTLYFDDVSTGLSTF